MIKVYNFKSAYKPHTNIKVIVNNNSFKLGGHTFNLNYHENSISVTSKTFKIDTGISFENLPYIGDQDSPEISIFQNLIGKGFNQMQFKTILNGKVNSAYHTKRFEREFTQAELVYLSELVHKDIKVTGLGFDIEYQGPDKNNPSGFSSLKHYVLNVIEG